MFLAFCLLRYVFGKKKNYCTFDVPTTLLPSIIIIGCKDNIDYDGMMFVFLQLSSSFFSPTVVCYCIT